MLDLHNHVLHGLDDGCRSPEESEALAKAARASGHVGFIATPHIRPGLFDNTPEGIRSRFDECRHLVEGAGLELHLGAEHYFDEHLLAAARSRELLTLAGSRYVLVEFPARHLPVRHGDVLFELRVLGYVPIIAHPERCRELEDETEERIDLLTRMGALFQLDLGSLVGQYGRGAKKLATQLLAQGAYRFAAGDLHRPGDVAMIGPARRELERLLQKRGRAAESAMLLEDNVRKVLRNAPVDDLVSI